MLLSLLHCSVAQAGHALPGAIAGAQHVHGRQRAAFGVKQRISVRATAAGLHLGQAGNVRSQIERVLGSCRGWLSLCSSTRIPAPPRALVEFFLLAYSD